jgi:hypothetical protein
MSSIALNLAQNLAKSCRERDFPAADSGIGLRSICVRAVNVGIQFAKTTLERNEGKGQAKQPKE